MILDTLQNASRYASLNENLAIGFGFLDQPGLADLAEGRHEINGDAVFAIVEKRDGRRMEEGRLEAHRNYLDIQYILSGAESMGWKTVEGLEVDEAYDAEKDLIFFKEAPDSLIAVPPGSFAIFLPSDAHLPLVGEGPIHKVVVKVALD